MIHRNGNAGTVEVYLDRYEDLCNSEARLEAILSYVKNIKELDRKSILIIAGGVPNDE